MATTAVDVKEIATSYIFVADMPGLKHSDIKVHPFKIYCLVQNNAINVSHMYGEI